MKRIIAYLGIIAISYFGVDAMSQQIENVNTLQQRHYDELKRYSDYNCETWDTLVLLLLGDIRNSLDPYIWYKTISTAQQRKCPEIANLVLYEAKKENLTMDQVCGNISQKTIIMHAVEAGLHGDYLGSLYEEIYAIFNVFELLLRKNPINGENLIHCAIASQNKDTFASIINILSETRDAETGKRAIDFLINEADKKGITPLHKALDLDNGNPLKPFIVEVLVENGANVFERLPRNIFRFLEFLPSYHNAYFAILKNGLKDNPIELKRMIDGNNDSESLILRALQSQDVRLMSLFIDAGGSLSDSLVQIIFSIPPCPLILRKVLRNKRVTQEEAGQFFENTINANWTLVAKLGDIQKEILDYIELLRELARLGANVQKIDNIGKTYLMKAVEKAKGIDSIISADNNRNYSHSLELVELLIELGIDVNDRDFYGNTALHHAISGGIENEAIIKLLVSNGALLDVTNNGDISPRQMLEKMNEHRLISELDGLTREHNSFFKRWEHVNHELLQEYNEVIRERINLLLNNLDEEKRKHLLNRLRRITQHFGVSEKKVDLIESILAGGEVEIGKINKKEQKIKEEADSIYSEQEYSDETINNWTIKLKNKIEQLEREIDEDSNRVYLLIDDSDEEDAYQEDPLKEESEELENKRRELAIMKEELRTAKLNSSYRGEKKYGNNVGRYLSGLQRNADLLRDYANGVLDAKVDDKERVEIMHEIESGLPGFEEKYGDRRVRDLNIKSSLMFEDLGNFYLLRKENADAQLHDYQQAVKLLSYSDDSARYIIQGPLHGAVINNDYNLVRILIANGSKVDEQDEHGNVPLCYANNCDMTQLLVEKGADTNHKSLKNKKSNSPVKIAKLLNITRD